MKTITLNLGDRSYDINIGNNLLANADNYFNLDRKVFILTDSGVPTQYAKTVKDLLKNATVFTVPEGEGAKSLSVLENVLCEMMNFNMDRRDALIAIGGGVVGDLGGFAASIYMRGIDFYNIPTTLLSQVDSSIGGKCAVNLMGTKNIIGSFYQPKGVLIDTDVLRTLPARHISAGMAESVKMALTSDAELFEFFEKEDDPFAYIEKIVSASLMIKKSVVEEDEKEKGLRKILNFGHTFGHGIEATMGLGALYHGECVALGMLPFCSEKVRQRLINVLKKLSLPLSFDNISIEEAARYALHDKKAHGGLVDAIFVEEVGSYEIRRMTQDEFMRHVITETARIKA